MVDCVGAGDGFYPRSTPRAFHKGMECPGGTPCKQCSLRESPNQEASKRVDSASA
jgi:hypothetical protein